MQLHAKYTNNLTIYTPSQNKNIFYIVAYSTQFHPANPYKKYYYIAAQYNTGTPYTPKW